MKIKALLLSAGFGTRLKPITNKIPKCLVRINNIPILEHWLVKLEKLGIDEVLINKHYLAEQVEEFLKERAKSNLKITQVYEEYLFGTAGTLIKNKSFFYQSNILFIHTDNYTTSDLSGLLESFTNRPKKCLMTMLTFDCLDPKSCGIVEVDSQGIVKSFHEKIANPPTNLANGAIYLFNYKLIDSLINEVTEFTDFSCDVIPKLINQINTWKVDKFFIDIGTPDSLKIACNHKDTFL
tara:strand:+ start:2519 stop:3232 length:714 start_codon:yes stop_codon:yes gene_type:complete